MIPNVRKTLESVFSNRMRKEDVDNKSGKEKETQNQPEALFVMLSTDFPDLLNCFVCLFPPRGVITVYAGELVHLMFDLRLALDLG